MGTHIFTVSEINKYLKSRFDEDVLLQDLWIRGECSNVREYRAGNQIYFTLKDQHSQISCVVFSQYRPAFDLTDDMELLIRGRVSIYERRGVYTLTVHFIEPAGIGALALAFEQLKRKLEEEGLFRTDLKKPIPLYPKKVAIISSPTGAALHDVVSTIRQRNASVQIVIVPAVVQGKDAASSLVNAIHLANKADGIEVIILARGGGSIEELWGFNEESVARAIFQSQLPVISAIGHETDFTIADFTADKRAATPTAAGVLVSLPKEEYLQHFISIRERLNHLLKQKVQELSMYLADTTFALTSTIKQIYNQKRHRADVCCAKLQALNPSRMIERGFVMVRHQGGLLKSARECVPGDIVDLLFHDGTIQSKIL